MRTKFSMKKKTAATITAGVLVAGTAAGAYAYWTTTGNGTASGHHRHEDPLHRTPHRTPRSQGYFAGARLRR